MTRSVCAAIAVAMVASLLFPVAPFGGAVGTSSAVDLELSAEPVPLTAVEFPDPIDTSAVVPEYTMVSRALMLPGGSSDLALEDLNDDGMIDMVVAVYEASTLSIFYKQFDGTFQTYPSLNITTGYGPMSVTTADVFGTGGHQLIALERDVSFSDARLAIYNMTSSSTYERWPDKTTYANAESLVVGELSGDSYSDIAVVCSGNSPETLPGRLKVFFGPDFTTYNDINVGLDPRSLAAADVDDDAELEIVVANYHSQDVMIFERPFDLGDPPSMVISVMGFPTGVACGNLDGDFLTDMVVATDAPSAIRFYFQSLGSLPAIEDYNISLPHSASEIIAEDVDNDGRRDLILLSQEDNVSFGYCQGISAPIWSDSPEFVFPTGGVPRAAVTGDLDGQGANDIAVASADLDWSGSSVALYLSVLPSFSNSNATAWTRSGVRATMLATGDVNGDDVIDLVLANSEDGSIDCHPGFGSITWTVALGFVPSEIMVADFNGDDRDDVLVTTEGGQETRLVLGAPEFPGLTLSYYVGGAVTDAMIGDFNHDSLTDFVVSTEDGRIDIFFNDGSSTAFDSPYELSPSGGAGIWAIAGGDFNSDGLDDIAYTRPIRKVTILLQNSSIPFGPSSPSLTLSHSVGTDFTMIWSGDLTGDGRTDIAATRPYDPALYLFDQDDFVLSPHPYSTLQLPDPPKFVSVLDATDDGPVDVIAVFENTDLLFLFRQDAGILPSAPSMVFVAGSDPSYATIGDGTGDHRGDMLVYSEGSHAVSVWEQINFPPIADAGGPYLTRQGDTLRFNGSAETGTSEIPFMEYSWDFGDGNSTGWVRNPNPEHTYLDVGNYTVTVAVMDPIGLNSSDASTVEVGDSYPHVRFTWMAESIREGQLVTFVDETVSYDPIVSREWFVDGMSSGSGVALNVSFQNGTHEVALNVTDSDGSNVKASEALEVLSMSPELRILGPPTAFEGTDVEFSVAVDEWHGGPVDSIVLYEWDFSFVDGSFVPDPVAPNSEYATHLFSTASYWKLCRIAVRVTDADGMVNLTTWDVQVFDVGPNASLTISSDNPQEGVPIYFFSTSTSFDGVVNWTWILRHPDGFEEVFYDTDVEMAERGFEMLNNGSYMISLAVREADGNTSYIELPFDVAEIPPTIALSPYCDAGWPGYFEEFEEICFLATVSSFDDVVSYEWDYDSPGVDFIPDAIGSSSSSNHTFSQVGAYVVKVRVTDADESSTTASYSIEIANKPFSGSFYSLVRMLREQWNTNNVSFDLVDLLQLYPDVTSAGLDFGDGTSWLYDGYGGTEISHVFATGSDYIVNLTVTDDDGYDYFITQAVWNDPPSIDLISPSPNAVVRSGTPIVFLIIPGSTALHSAVYSIDGSGFIGFGEMYRIDTAHWAAWNHSVQVVAQDYGGNIKRYNTTIIVDDTNPFAVLSIAGPSVFGGDKLNVTIMVDDRNMDASGLELYVTFQGESAYSTFSMSKGKVPFFFRVLDIPERVGVIQMYANVTDKAGNSFVTQVYQFEVELHFLDRAWPYLLVSFGAVALSVPAYLLREHRLAVDEAFVIFRDGRMISHSTRRLKPGMDDHVLGAMLVAIQDFVKDSFKDVTSFALRRLDFGDKSVLVERGEHIFLAVVLHGQASRKVAVRMQKVVGEIEDQFSHHLEGWDGDLDKMRGVGDVTRRLYSRMPMFPGQRGRAS